MLLESLTMHNFRCFEEREIPFSERFTLLIGDNGRGKTAVIEAIAATLGAYARSLGVSARPLERADARVMDDGTPVPGRARIPVSLRARAQFKSESFAWIRTLIDVDGRFLLKDDMGDFRDRLKRLEFAIR